MQTFIKLSSMKCGKVRNEVLILIIHVYITFQREGV